MIPDTKIINQLALLTGGRSATPSQIERAFADVSAERWRLLANAAQAEGLAPLVDSNLRKYGIIALVPPDVQEQLRDEHRSNQLYFALQMRALSSLTNALDAQGIPCRLIKGAAVGTYAYRDPGTRAVGDIDLWVKPADIARATKTLHALDLHQINVYYPGAFLKAFVGEQEFAPDDPYDTVTYVDLHWHLINDWWLRSSIQIPEQLLFDDKHVITVKGCSYPTLSPTHTLYHLCLHTRAGYHHQGWRRLLEIHLLAKTDAIDWDTLNTLSATSGASTILWRTFELADMSFGSAHSSRLTKRPAPWHRFAVRQLLAKPTPYEAVQRGLTTRRHPLLISLLLLPNIQAMASMIIRIVWPPARWIRLRYGVKGKWSMLRARLYHILRLKDLHRQKAPQRT